MRYEEELWELSSATSSSSAADIEWGELATMLV